jgi:hypothetical protein
MIVDHYDKQASFVQEHRLECVAWFSELAQRMMLSMDLGLMPSFDAVHGFRFILMSLAN